MNERQIVRREGLDAGFEVALVDDVIDELRRDATFANVAGLTDLIEQRAGVMPTVVEPREYGGERGASPRKT